MSAADAPGRYQYSTFLGAAERWVWSGPSDESVYLFNDTRGSTEKMLNFADAVGSRYTLSLERA